MPQVVIENPILNSPFEEPSRHFRFDAENSITSEIVLGRRPSTAIVPVSKDSDFLQVTATPYSLYLQPEEDVIEAGQLLFKPRRPAFTVVLPTHGRYVGGDYYFEKNTDAESPAYYFYREVPLEEREALKVEDRRRIKIEHILSEKRAAVLCDAIFTFLVGGAILRLQARARKDTPDKYAFLFHTEQARKSHDWQERIAVAIRDSLIAEAQEDTPRFNELLHRSYSDLKRSVNLEGSPLSMNLFLRRVRARSFALKCRKSQAERGFSILPGLSSDVC